MAVEASGRFWRISTAGIFFQGGAAAVDAGTVVAALVHGLTGSAVAVGAAAAIARFGWLFPQIIVAYYAQRRTRRLPFYMAGAFGRAACLTAVAALLWFAPARPSTSIVVAFFAMWTLYAFVSGIVAVPYNDIVARSIPSEARSRVLAWRFFGGGVLALAVAYAANRILAGLQFPRGYAAVALLGALLLFASALFFVSAGEPRAASGRQIQAGFFNFLRGGGDVYATDHRFRLFVIAQWLGGAAAIALPFYVLQAQASAPEVALLLGAQTAGALVSNPLWGWYGDRRGKRELLEVVAALNTAAPMLTLIWIASGGRWNELALTYFGCVFLLLGAVGNGSTIAQLGYLMEISPDDRRPAYSGYFNVLVAPAALLPIAGGAIMHEASAAPVFALSLAAAVLQIIAVRRLRVMSIAGTIP
ncbi:MAG: MFS transporter [Betaproteobacteria bacterium]|nr:MFS transporter [Betaproteobacteria bacterium]